MSSQVLEGLAAAPAVRVRPATIAGLLVVAATAVVVAYGWISDDGYITARYADNLLRGYGPVFNLGERVQGYTHPLWFLLLTPALAILQEPLLAAVALGAIFTALTMSLIYGALRETRAQAALPLFAAVTAVLLLSESWRSFQTGGLENSLSHFLIALIFVELVRHPGLRPGRLTLICALLVLTRPDFAVLVAPLSIFVTYTAVRRRQVHRLLLGSAPLLAWLAFAWAYYGTVIPNTATSKLGVYSQGDAIRRGLTYVLDWLYYEPASGLVAAACTLVVVRTARRPGEAVLLLGFALYFAGVIAGAGDFMRGRMILPLFFYLVLAGAVGIARLSAEGSLPSSRRWVLAAAAAVTCAAVLAPAQTAEVQDSGIVNERLYYPGQWLNYYVSRGEVNFGTQVTPPEVVAELKAFAETCGPFGFHEHAVGGVAYYAGPRVSVIDTIGLTDAYIARLPNSYLVNQNPRPGHARRAVPYAYLAGRSDIRLFGNWDEAVQAGDCGIIAAAQGLASSSDLLTTRDTAARYE
jgi:arabinofuranosyltransferase